MDKRQSERILVTYFRAQDLYDQFADELHRILDGDRRFPIVYTVKHRFKGQDRLIEKIDSFNATARKGATLIDASNFQDKVDDLLGVRIVCLRLADLAKVKSYLYSLRDERKIKFLKGPTEKKTFLLTPAGMEPEQADMQYSGYSSIHYVVQLGRSLQRARPELGHLKAELQLRTIFEEAWGEIDHKYRYELTRSGKNIPQHVHNGFRDLALYLQAAARQADHICEDVSVLVTRPQSLKKKKSRSSKKPVVPTVAPPPPELPVTTVAASLTDVFKDTIQFVPSPTTLAYCHRRLAEHSFHWGRPFAVAEFRAALTDHLLARFKDIYRDTLGHEPFSDSSQRDLDLLPLVNFTIFSTVQSRDAAEAGLRAALRSRPRW